MRRYETVVIVDPDISEDERNALLDRVRETVAKENGFLVEVDEWGGRKLAYPIKKKPRGHYYRLDYCGGGPLVQEMERSFRIDDRVMKFLTVQLETQVDIEKIQEEVARAAAEQEAAEARAEAETTASETEGSEKEPEAETAAAETPEAPNTGAAETEGSGTKTEAQKEEE